MTEGEKLRARRQAMGMTQTQMADALGLSKSFVGMMERGTRSIEKRTWLAIAYLEEHPENR